MDVPTVVFRLCFAGGSGSEEPACQHRRLGFDSWAAKIPLEEGAATRPSVPAWRIPPTDRGARRGSRPRGHQESDPAALGRGDSFPVLLSLAMCLSIRLQRKCPFVSSRVLADPLLTSVLPGIPSFANLHLSRAEFLQTSSSPFCAPRNPIL